ncbi:MAG TPA: tetratricopeptide repeat protein [Planctomycetota bacterium]|nr:tetratricopeptide repeat protein [Planctomycetota bacterium]
MHAELAYLFRHALLRDAAYQLQLPGERARLHALALDLLEGLLGVPPRLEFDASGEPEFRPHPCDPHALDLAAHAAAASSLDAAAASRELLYVERASYRMLKAHDLAQAASLMQRAAAHPLQPASRRVLLLLSAGRMLHVGGRGAEAQALLREGTEQARALGLDAALARGLTFQGIVLHEANRLEEALQHYEQALTLRRALGDRRMEGALLDNISASQARQGKAAQAEENLRRALEIFGELGDEHFTGGAMVNYGLLLMRTARQQEARDMLEQGLARLRSTGDRRGEGMALSILGGWHLNQGRHADALALSRQALEVHRQVGNRRSEAKALGTLGVVLRRSGAAAAAEQHQRAALALYEDLEDRTGYALALSNLAQVLVDLGRLDEAAALFERAIEMQHALRYGFGEGMALCDYALCLTAQGQIEQAKEAWRRGVPLLAAHASPPEVQRVKAAMLAVCARAQVPSLES